MGAEQHRTLITVLGVAAAAASILAAPGPATADNWWPSRQFAFPENADVYHDGEVYREFLLNWEDEKGLYTTIYHKPRDAYFNGKRLTRSYQSRRDGINVKTWGRDGKYFRRVILYREGEPYLTQIPHFSENTATWQPFTARRPLPITGTLKVTVDVFMKERGERPQWNCSVYYKDVCRWWKGHKAVPPHKVRTVTKRWKVTTTIGPDKFTSKGRGLGLGLWDGDVSTAPAEFTSNPMLPVVDNWYRARGVCGVGKNDVCGLVLDNEVHVTFTRIGK